MLKTDLNIYKALFEDLDPDNLKLRFLKLLLEIQGVARGSIWVKEDNGYRCIEAIGGETGKNRVKGVFIPGDQSSLVGWVITKGEMTVADAGEDPRHYKAFEDGLEVKSTCILCYPLILRGGEVYGAVQIIETDSGGNRMNLDEQFLEQLQGIVDVGSIALSNALNFSEQLEKNVKLEQALDNIRTEIQIIGQSRALLDAMKKVRDYAQTDFPVLITGESGTGKDLIARELHRLSSRNNKTFVVQNCSAIPQTLLESELFGYKKGAFTGATEDKIGLLQAADGGTIFLDEIGDMALELQARVLRVIENGEIKPLGQAKTRKIDVRIISATNKDLNKAISNKEFRQDLYYRLNVLPLHLPPLRERKMDIPLLLIYFLKKESIKLTTPLKTFTSEAIKYLQDYPWKGNIRELENFVKYIISTAGKDTIDLDNIPEHILKRDSSVNEATPSVPTFNQHISPVNEHLLGNNGSGFSGYTWMNLEKAYVSYLLEKNKWNITRAAREANLNRSTFDSRMKKLGISKN
ncbi:sigma 54-interacting transcriptional regulator [Thermodesulfobacteriota bacterium]